MKIKIEPGTSNERTLRRIAIAFAKQLFSGRRLGASNGKPRTVLLKLQSHNLAEGKNGEILTKFKGEENDKDEN